MALSEEQISAIRNASSNRSNPIEDIEDQSSSAVKDPFGSIITKSLSKIGSLSIGVESKINQLANDLVKSVDTKGRVSLQGDVIVITLSSDDVADGAKIKKNIEDKVKSIRNLLTLLDNTLKSLSAIQKAISALQTALTIQETLLSINPATGPMLLVVKKGIKIIFIKEMIKEYSKILKRQLNKNIVNFERISNRFRNLQVSIVVQGEKNKGNDITALEAESMIAQDLLNQGVKGNQEDIKVISEEFSSPSQTEYILKVEKYDTNKLIAVAYDKESGMAKSQTSPSFFATPEELLEELKSILNIEA